MKGFPNQIADFGKLSAGLRIALNLSRSGQNAKDNGVFGTALVRGSVAGTGHTPMPVEEYLAEQEGKPAGSQGHRTAARGLRELYRRLGLIDDDGAELIVTPLGEQAASYADQPMSDEQIIFWRTALSNMGHDGDGALSHPYQVLLRLVSRRPGITRAKCALALEARDDSNEELDRICDLAELDEADILEAIGVSQSNWDNAKKMLPRFAEQLGDVVKDGQQYTLAQAPGDVAPTRETNVAPASAGDAPATRVARNPRQVTPDTIGQAGIGERTEPAPPPNLDPEKMAAAVATRADRVRRHNLIVRELAARLERFGFRLFEDPFDILAVRDRQGLLVEVKTLDGSEADERDRVRDALAQLLYYEAFVTAPLAEGCEITKLACFESRPSDDHIQWLQNQGIVTIWKSQGEFEAAHFNAEWLE